MIETLSAFGQIPMTVEALKSSSQALAKQEKKIFKLNEDAISALTRLESRLNDAINSRFADGTKWLHDFEDQQNIVYRASCKTQVNFFSGHSPDVLPFC